MLKGYKDLHKDYADLHEKLQPGDLVSIDARAFSVNKDIFAEDIQLGVCLHKHFSVDGVRANIDGDLGWTVFAHGQQLWFPTSCLNRI